jgi:hypothetical protein
MKLDRLEYAKRNVRDLASRIGQSYEMLMSAADGYVNGGNYTYDNNEGYKEVWDSDSWEKFWLSYEIIRDVKVKEKERTTVPFTCSC